MRSIGLIANFIAPTLVYRFKDSLSEPTFANIFLVVFGLCQSLLIAVETAFYPSDSIAMAAFITFVIASTIIASVLYFQISFEIYPGTLEFLILCACVFAYFGHELIKWLRVHMISSSLFVMLFSLCLFKDCQFKHLDKLVYFNTYDLATTITLIVDLVGLFLSVLYIFA